MAAALRRRVARGPQLARTAVASQLNTVTGEGRMLVTGDSADRSVLATLFTGVPLTRPELATRTGLSRPTISEAVRRLVETGLIVPAGVRRGGLGRIPTYYRLASTAGYVVAVDIGGDNLRIAVADLGGTIQHEDRQRTKATGARRVAAQAARVVQDNNVNLAALGERWRGHARDVVTFAFLAVGAGIGMGLVHNGEVVRGAHGAAGEVAYLPLPGVLPRRERVGHGRELLAAEAGGYGMLAALDARKSWPGKRPTTVAELFDQAAAGVPAAVELVEAEGRHLGLTVASACVVFDPELVVLGGGIGSNPQLLPAVREAVSTLVPFPPRVETSALGDVASLTGALYIALEGARADLLRTVTAAETG